MKDCIFCKIIKKEIPVNIIYEDEKILAFLDINPVNKGHTLVIPKEHSRYFYEAEDETLKELTIIVKKLSKVIIKALNAKNVNIAIAGEDVPHTHIHIIPRFENDNIKWLPTKKYQKGEAEQTAMKIKNLLK